MSRLRSVLSLIATMAIGGALLLAVTQRPLDSPGSDPGGSQSTGTVVSRPSGPVADTTAASLPTCTDPLTHLTTFDRASVRVAELARVSTFVLEGTITSIGQAEWNTPDGRPSSTVSATDVRRIATVEVGSGVEVGGSGKNLDRGTSVSVALPGGTIGCDAYRLDGFVDADVGDRVVLFVQPVEADRAGAGLGMARVGWPVGMDGSVQTPEDGELLSGDLVSLAATR